MTKKYINIDNCCNEIAIWKKISGMVEKEAKSNIKI